jgi:hypothetical protein
MIRKPSLSVDQVERLEKSGIKPSDMFVEEDAPKQDKRKEPKEYVFRKLPTGLWKVALSAGGQIPCELQGCWTTSVKAQQAVNSYINHRDGQTAS